jgi:DNA invertase Pin-like site-specific DNA recombinase
MKDKNQPLTYGYARVSTTEQNLDRQLIALKAAGVPEANIFADKRSGKDFNRPAWKRLVRKLRAGDILVVKSIDRFGRSYDEIIFEWEWLSRRKKVHLRVLDMPLLDTTAAHGLLAVFIANIVLQILSFVAETERQQIKARQREGIAAARARGVRFGRPKVKLPPEFSAACESYLNRRESLRSAAQSCGLPQTTFWRSCRK